MPDFPELIAAMADHIGVHVRAKRGLWRENRSFEVLSVSASVMNHKQTVSIDLNIVVEFTRNFSVFLREIN